MAMVEERMGRYPAMRVAGSDERCSSQLRHHAVPRKTKYTAPHKQTAAHTKSMRMGCFM